MTVTSCYANKVIRDLESKDHVSIYPRITAQAIRRFALAQVESISSTFHLTIVNIKNDVTVTLGWQVSSYDSVICIVHLLLISIADNS